MSTKTEYKKRMYNHSITIAVNYVRDFFNLIRSVRAKEIPFKSLTSKSGQGMQIIDP